jgi:hypothetical protein
MRNMEEDGWWMVLTTVCPLLARFFIDTINPSEVDESRPVVAWVVMCVM